MSRKKYSIEDVDIIFREKGLILRSTEYKNSKEKLEYICPVHEAEGIQKINLNNLLNNSGCKYCGREKSISARRISQDEVERIFNENGYLLIDNYTSYSGILKFLCKKHVEKGEQETSLFLVKKNKTTCCKYCSYETSGNMKLKIDYVKNEFKKRNYICLDDTYTNNRTDINYICLKHDFETQQIKWRDFRQGHNCKYCAIENMAEKQRHSFDFVKQKFSEKNLILLEQSYLNNEQRLKFLCQNHKEKGEQKISFSQILIGQGCKYCGYERNSGENNCNWQGGISSLYQHLRTKINKWKFESLKHYDFKCVITNSNENDLEVHHLTNFNDIVFETLKSLDMVVHKNIGDYTSDELERIETLCIELHYKYGFGVPLKQSIHKEFHSIYGIKNNSIEQFEEFKSFKLRGLSFEEIVSIKEGVAS